MSVSNVSNQSPESIMDVLIDVRNILKEIHQIVSREGLQNAPPVEPISIQPRKPMKKKPSVTDEINQLIAVGFFDMPKDVGEVCSKLMQYGFNTPSKNISVLLSRFVKGRKLIREKQDGNKGKWTYTVRP